MRFVDNAKENKLSRTQAKRELLEAGWSIDRINYAIKKTFKKEDLVKGKIVTPKEKSKKGRKINKSKKTLQINER